VTEYVTKFGSLADFDKGNIELINDQAKNYAFSNIFEVANSSKPWEKVAVGKNMQYVLEAIRAEGTSEWRTCAHDEFPLCMDGEVTIELVKLDTPAEIKAQALPIKAQTVVSRVMPLGNLTEMTEEERDLLGRWVNQGARVD